MVVTFDTFRRGVIGFPPAANPVRAELVGPKAGAAQPLFFFCQPIAEKGRRFDKLSANGGGL